VSLEKLKQPIDDFKSLKMAHSSQFTGSIVVTLDSLGNVNYRRDSFTILNHDAKVFNIKGHLASSEFENFKSILSKSLIFRLPENRGCGIDEGQTEFTYIGNRKFFTKGCKMYFPQWALFRYLSNLDKNAGFRIENK
jgi:hypothetical protein